MQHAGNTFAFDAVKHQVTEGIEDVRNENEHAGIELRYFRVGQQLGTLCSGDDTTRAKLLSARNEKKERMDPRCSNLNGDLERKDTLPIVPGVLQVLVLRFDVRNVLVLREKVLSYLRLWVQLKLLQTRRHLVYSLWLAI
jgi:hypothetical protein